jgi:alpha-beta hydrolase superfamily lysophospholipase
MASKLRPRQWIKPATILLVPLCVAVALTTGATQVFAYLAVHPPRERLSETPEQFGMTFEEVTFATSDDLLLSGWFIPAQGARAAVILGHGFTRSRQEMLDVAAMLNRNGYHVLLFDWRAHGKSGGERSTFGHTEIRDLRAALDFVAHRPEVDPERIGVLGKSMGAAIAISGAASMPQLKAVVSDSPYPSLEESIEIGVRRRGPLGVWPFRSIASALGLRAIGIDPDLVRPIDDIGEISPRPVLILHGGRDELVPPDTGSQMLNAASEPKSLWFDPNASHVTLSAEQPKEYETRIVQFFDAALKPQKRQGNATGDTERSSARAVRGLHRGYSGR